MPQHIAGPTRVAAAVEHDAGVLEVRAGEAVVAPVGERVRCWTPEEGAEHVAVCLPAFALERDAACGMLRSV